MQKTALFIVTFEDAISLVKLEKTVPLTDCITNQRPPIAGHVKTYNDTT
jgi:hypothetical protein